MRIARAEEIFLAQVTKLGANFARDRKMIVDDQTHRGSTRDGQDRSGHPADFLEGGLFRPELNQIGAAPAKLARNFIGSAPAQGSLVDERIEPALRKRFHYATWSSSLPAYRVRSNITRQSSGCG